MADAVELRMSVSSIKRVDPYVKDILATSTHVALYRFNPNLNEWERTETEGALFLYSRSGEPWHSVMIMNRLNTNNLIEPISKEFEYQMQPPFLLYRNSKNKIFGIWFYNREECINITYLLESLMETLKERLVEKTKKKESGVDIFSMLSKAQEDFNNKTPTKMELSTQPQFSSTPRVVEFPSQSVMDFFAKAGTKPVKPRAAPQGNSENLLQRLMSNPAHSVEHIEKQQRSVTPQDSIQNKQPDRNKSLPSYLSSMSLRNMENVEPEPVNGLNFIRNSSPHQGGVQGTSPLAAFLMQGNITLDEPEISGTSPLASFLETPQKPQLMPPMMFATSSTSKEKTEVVTGGVQQEGFDKGVNLLTSSQLAQALIYLLKNDGDFVAKVHEAYTKSVNEKLNCANGNPLK